jgi:hypothetical protein
MDLWVERDSMMEMVINDREWKTQLLYVMIEHVPCSRYTQSSDSFQIMNITKQKNTLKIPHHDCRVVEVVGVGN